MTTIVSAAVLDDRTGKVYEGGRHFDPIMGAAIDEDLDNPRMATPDECAEAGVAGWGYFNQSD